MGATNQSALVFVFPIYNPSIYNQPRLHFHNGHNAKSGEIRNKQGTRSSIREKRAFLSLFQRATSVCGECADRFNFAGCAGSASGNRIRGYSGYSRPMHKAADNIRDETLISTPPRQVGLRVDLQLAPPTPTRQGECPSRAQPSPTAGPFFLPLLHTRPITTLDFLPSSGENLGVVIQERSANKF